MQYYRFLDCLRRRFSSGACLLALLLFGAGGTALAQAQEAGQCSAAVSAEEILQRLNEARVRGAVCHRSGETMAAAPVTWSQSLAAAATHQAREMAKLNQMRHRDSQDRGLAQRLRALDYRFGKAVENVAVGYATLDAVIAAWLASEGHCDNLMNAGVVEFGLACSDVRVGSGDPVRYWALVLGRPKTTP